MSLEHLGDAFHDELRDVLSAERQLLKAIPKMVSEANSTSLKAALEAHLAETENHVTRVIDTFKELGKSPRSKLCKAMKGLIEEAQEMLEEESNETVKDAIIIAMAQKIEHYEIATYGTLATWAEVIGLAGCHQLLSQNLAEEEAADKKLTKLAQQLNPLAKATTP